MEERMRCNGIYAQDAILRISCLHRHVRFRHAEGTPVDRDAEETSYFCPCCDRSDFLATNLALELSFLLKNADDWFTHFSSYGTMGPLIKQLERQRIDQYYNCKGRVSENFRNRSKNSYLYRKA